MKLDSLFGPFPFSVPEDEKSRVLLKIMKPQLKNAIENNGHISRMYSKLGIRPDELRRLEDVPPIPVQMFKQFDLKTCGEENIVKVLRSSGTTEGTKSRVPLSKITTMNQIKALKSLLQDRLGDRRLLFLVIDHEGINDPTLEFSARTAGVRGLSMYAKKIVYLMKEENGALVLNREALDNLLDMQEEGVYVFGFTYIIWSTFFKQMREENRSLDFPGAKIFHSGGWKKLREEMVSKEMFSDCVSEVFGTTSDNVIDFYGMAEQTGLIFMDCEQGNKHVPAFAQIIVRNPYTMRPCDIGEVGVIEVMSVLADSYYCQALLTEDLGHMRGVDDCPCGRKGRYFRFDSRIEKVEVRGCGDTFREG